MTLKKQILSLLILCFSINSFSQELTQTIRGTVVEKILQKPIEGASIQIIGKSIGDRTDEYGNFIITNVPLGSQSLLVSSIGFKENIVSNIVVNAGKEVVLTITLEEKIIQGKEVVIKSGRKKNTPLNEMSAVSARSFTVEETQKYAAAVNDPARMASNYAGVAMADDGNNQIVIRGNSPAGLLWRMEGVDIPNPNHFATPGSSGGGISILSTQVLSNSDFVTGAFAAEYGNALSGVFDLKLRKGNNEKREYSFQAGILGLNATIEGPIMPLYKGSYLINYRYSTLNVLSKIGLLPGISPTIFQDLSYNISLPTNHLGNFTLFSFGGLSNQFYNAVKDSLKWKNEGEKYSDNFISNTGLWGATHSINIGKKNLLKTVMVYSLNKTAYDRNYFNTGYDLLNVYSAKYITKKITLSSTLNQRINSKAMLRSGVILNHINFNYKENIRNDYDKPLEQLVNTNSSTQTIQLFSQLQYKLNDKFTFNGGLHYLQLLLNNSYSLEPRASIKYDIDGKNSISFGYGNHSQTQAWGVYFAENTDSNNQISLPNKNLKLSKANHFVMSHNYNITKNLRIKTEIYYQQLYKIPVSISDTNTISAINFQYDYVRDELKNNGTGRNYGIEISLEKYLSNHFYYTLSSSFYQSKYTASNLIEYNSKYNGNHIINFIAGKEYESKSKRRTLGLNIKTLYAGGYRTTPINLTESIAQEKTIYYQDKSFENKLPNYFRTDIRLSMKWNRKRFTSTLSLDIQNVTNRQNVYDQFYDINTKSVKTYFQTGLLPILNYKVEF